MKAVVIKRFGGPEVLSYEEVTDPIPTEGDIQVAVSSVSVNYTLDCVVRQGTYARPVKLPHIVGVDPSGTITKLGANVQGFELGQRVSIHSSIRCGNCEGCLAGNRFRCKHSTSVGIHRWGGYAELITVPSQCVHKIPNELAFEEATVILRHFPTARHLLKSKAKLKKGEWILVMGAAGGLGASCIQVAKLMGATVIAAASSDERVRLALERGADFGINYRTNDLAKEISDLTEGRLVSVVADNIGDPKLWVEALNSLGNDGRLVTAGAHGGGIVPLDVNRLYLKRITISGSPGSNPEDIDWTMKEVWKGTLKAAPISGVLPLYEAAEAHRKIESRSTTGKILLNPTL
tara:strand:+ start:468 stop:1511 length:1044 start_codon:yes stop_codon:yes gene_type:complete